MHSLPPAGAGVGADITKCFTRNSIPYKSFRHIIKSSKKTMSQIYYHIHTDSTYRLYTGAGVIPGVGPQPKNKMTFKQLMYNMI